LSNQPHKSPRTQVLLHLKGLGDDVVVEADVVPAMAAAVHPRPNQLRHRHRPSPANISPLIDSRRSRFNQSGQEPGTIEPRKGEREREREAEAAKKKEIKIGTKPRRRAASRDASIETSGAAEAERNRLCAAPSAEEEETVKERER
jgi:hypothetical protein